MKKIFKKIKLFFINLFNKIKNLFKNISIETTIEEPNNPIAESETPINEWLNDENLPIDPENIKLGEIGGYIIYDKTKGVVVDDEFINNLQELGINILYFNTPRDKSNIETYLSYEEWLEIFNKFTDTGIKLMLYIYETLEKKDSEGNIIYKKWTDTQIKKISNHQAFYGWIAEDEVGYTQFTQTKAWITKFHSQTWKDGTRKWPIMSICFFPKTPRLINEGAIGGDYDRYLETYSNSADVFFADMYPIQSTKVNKNYYNITEDGISVYSKTEGGKNWYDYLKSHLIFTNNHPESTHRLYLHACKHIAKETNTDRLYVAKYRPTESSLKVQSYANLMAGSNGLMLFVLCDIPTGENIGFYDAAFNTELKPNEYTYNLMKSVYTSKKFQNYKNIMVNLYPDDIVSYNTEEDDIIPYDFISQVSRGAEILIGSAHNNDANYYTILNTSLTESISITINDGLLYMDLTNNKVKKTKNDEQYTIEPCEIIVVKKNIIITENDSI